MLHRMLLGVIVLCLFNGFALSADEPSVDSPEAFKAVCDEAMPDLLSGNAKGAEPFRKVAPETVVAQLAYFPRRELEKLRDDIGEPIDWKYLGEKRLGDKVIQLLYVARYSQNGSVWRFTTEEKNGRWKLASLNVSSADQILPFCVDGVEKNEDCIKLCESLAMSLTRGKDESQRLFAEASGQPEAIYLHRMGPTVMQAADILSIRYGKLQKIELLTGRDIAGVLGSYCYRMQFEGNTVYCRFVVYRAKDDWQLKAFLFNDNPDVVFGQSEICLRADKTSVGAAANRSGETRR